MMRGLCILFLAGILNGCVTPTDFAPAVQGQKYESRTPPEKIELFRSQTPPKKFTEIGSVTSCCGLRTEAVVAILRKKASEMGGDAMIGLELEGSGRATASVIRYNDVEKPKQ